MGAAAPPDPPAESGKRQKVTRVCVARACWVGPSLPSALRRARFLAELTAERFVAMVRPSVLAALCALLLIIGVASATAPSGFNFARFMSG